MIRAYGVNGDCSARGGESSRTTPLPLRINNENQQGTLKIGAYQSGRRRRTAFGGVLSPSPWFAAGITAGASSWRLGWS